MNGKTILVVDDEPTSIELMDFVLKKNGFNSLTASRAEEALQILETVSPDLIILDLLMPIMSGTDLCKHIKADPRTAKIPVIFVSAMVAEKEIESGFKAGAAGYLFKPFEADDVVKKIREILGLLPS